MHGRIATAAALVLLTLLTHPGGAGTTREARLEEVVKQTVGILDKLGDSLATVRDEESAKSAVPELRKGAGEFLELRKKAEGMPPPSREEKDRVSKLYRTKLEAAHKKLITEVVRVGTVTGGREALQEIAVVLNKKKGL